MSAHNIFIDYKLGTNFPTHFCIGCALFDTATQEVFIRLFDGHNYPQTINSNTKNNAEKHLFKEQREEIKLIRRNIMNWVKAKRLPIKSKLKPYHPNFWTSMEQLIEAYCYIDQGEWYQKITGESFSNYARANIGVVL